MARATVLSFVSALILTAIFLSNRGCVFAVGQCDSDLRELKAQCLAYVKIGGPTTEPNSACCSAVQKADIPCACNSVTNETFKTVSMTKLVSVASKCGKPLAPGYQCGAYTVPEA